jgi:acetyl esterase/lipase
MGFRLTNIHPTTAIGATVRLLDDGSMPAGYRLVLLRRLADAAGLLRNPFGVQVKRINDGALRGIRVTAAGASADNGIVLYLHGGGFVFGSTRSHFGLVKRLSAASAMPVFLLRYRLAPEHPFPAAADDTLAAYRALLGLGYEPTRITLAGDSAGGHLVCSLLGDAARLGLPMPAAAVLFSPCLDLTGADALARDALRPDPVISAVMGAKLLRSYLRETSPDDPRVAILEAPKSGWPPTLIQVGDTECLLGDSERLAESLDSAAVPHQLQVWPGQVHVFQALARYSPAAREALLDAGQFLRTSVDQTSSSERGSSGG